MRQVVLDTETTGLLVADGHRIIEIGCIELVDRERTGRHFHTYLQPQREVDPGAFAVHGISDKFLADKPLFAHVSEDFIRYIEGAELIIHNAPFDIGFLDSELARLKLGTIAERCTVLDTLVLARTKHPGQQNSLDALCKRYGISLSERSLHGALLDAELLASVYLAMTGGQTSLFDVLEFGPSVVDKGNATLVSEAVIEEVVANLKVIFAKPEELALHEAQLADIQKVSGSCIWSE
ncbi:MAG: polymerase epsilon subunit [Gammaproteobacteria bacterium]|jgi:DNA polymerase-3 subunit epsilon|nr:polymerase epsilon subunit [Gammaproteobacteria bacterium]